MSTLTVNNLNHEWKADVSTVTDAQGYYQLSNLPISWTSVRLRAVLEGYGTGQAEYESTGLSSVRGCYVQLTEGQPENTAYSDSDLRRTGASVLVSSDSELISSALKKQDDPNAEHFQDIHLGGQPIRAGGASIVGVVPSALHQNLVLYYSFYSDSDPTTVTDISGRGYHGQVHGAEYDRHELLDGTMSFDGEDDYVSVQGVSLSQFTFAAWVKTETTGTNNRRVFQLSDDQNCYTVEGNGNGGVSSYVTRDIEINEYNWRFSRGTWAHVTVTFDGSSLKIYIYGVLTEARSGTSDQGIEGTAYIGGIRSFDGGFWHGNIDEVALFSRALTEDEVWQLFSMTGEYVEIPTQEPEQTDFVGRSELTLNEPYHGSDAPYRDDEEDNVEYKELLYGSLIDERGNAVAGARVFGSYAQHATTDSNGSFALAISPEDGSNSAGPADFPMYVWAYEENDPYRVAWTLIRHPASAEKQFERTRSFSSKLRSEEEWQQLRREATQYPITEQTHQGVKLLIEDENDLAQYIHGNPGRLENPNGSPTVHDIVLVMGSAGVITGRVTDANGSAVAGAKVSIDQLQMQLGTNSLTISELDHDWKAEAFAVTDAQGYYQLNNLPASWTTIKLKAQADGYAAARQEFQNAGGNKLDGCDAQLVEAEQQDSDTTAVEFEAGQVGMGMYGGYRRARE
jgi:protocatechuate 3,4-dioxygenase beta subunit